MTKRVACMTVVKGVVVVRADGVALKELQLRVYRGYGLNYVP